MKKNETGRSMIEMLAVFAIIGVLTVTSVMAYRIAMNKHQANTITEMVSLLSIYAETRNISVESLADFKKEYEESIPNCVVSASATAEGLVTIGFDNTDTCKEIMQLVENNFGSKRWQRKSKTEGYFSPAGKFE